MKLANKHIFSLMLILLCRWESFGNFGAVAFTPLTPARTTAIRTSPCRTTVVYHAKMDKGRESTASATPSLSSLRSILKMVVPGPRPNSIESSIGAALVLTDKKRQEQWKKDIRQQFPLVPSFAIDACIDSLSDTFSAIAPAEVKAALRPGGLVKVRPGLEKTIISNLEAQAVMKNIPLRADEKRQLLQYLVSTSLDYVLKDAEILLAEPAIKLQALELQKQEVQKFMTLRQLAWYRIRFRPVQTGLLVVVMIYVTYSLYQQTKHAWIVCNMKTIILTTIVQLKLLGEKLLKVFGKDKTKLAKQKVARHSIRR